MTIVSNDLPKLQSIGDTSNRIVEVNTITSTNWRKIKSNEFLPDLTEIAKTKTKIKALFLLSRSEDINIPKGTLKLKGRNL